MTGKFIPKSKSSNTEQTAVRSKDKVEDKKLIKDKPPQSDLIRTSEQNSQKRPLEQQSEGNTKIIHESNKAHMIVKSRPKSQKRNGRDKANAVVSPVKTSEKQLHQEKSKSKEGVDRHGGALEHTSPNDLTTPENVDERSKQSLDEVCTVI